MGPNNILNSLTRHFDSGAFSQAPDLLQEPQPKIECQIQLGYFLIVARFHRIVLPSGAFRPAGTPYSIQRSI